MRRKVPAPSDREARKNSCSLSLRTWPRIRRAELVQPVRPMAMVIEMIPGLKDEHGKDGDYEDGDADQDLDDTLHDVVHPATVVPGEGTVGHADAMSMSGNQGGDVQRDPGAHPDPVEHAAPELVGAEPEPGERGRLVLPFEILPEGR